MADPLARAIELLSRVPLGAFTRERNATAAALKKAGEPAQVHAVRQLRRPSAPLWATNQLAHEDPSGSRGSLTTWSACDGRGAMALAGEQIASLGDEGV